MVAIEKEDKRRKKESEFKNEEDLKTADWKKSHDIGV
jgi:hypothetical protein